MNVVKLNWTTTMEINCRSYTIERSEDGKAFVNAGTVTGSGNTNVEKNYFFNDDITAVKNNTVYYRLKQTDLDGRNSYSKIISIKLKTTTNGFTVSPNPFSSYINISVEWSKSETANIKVISMNGKELVSKKMQLIKGTNYVALNELTMLPSGMYILQVNSTEGSIIKQVSKQ